MSKSKELKPAHELFSELIRTYALIVVGEGNKRQGIKYLEHFVRNLCKSIKKMFIPESHLSEIIDHLKSTVKLNTAYPTVNKPIKSLIRHLQWRIRKAKENQALKMTAKSGRTRKMTPKKKR